MIILLYFKKILSSFKEKINLMDLYNNSIKNMSQIKLKEIQIIYHEIPQQQ